MSNFAFREEFRMKKRLLLFSLTLFSIIALAACSGNLSVTPGVDSAATAVAATMSAFSVTATAGAISSDPHTSATDIASQANSNTPILRASFVATDGSLWVWTDGTQQMVQLTDISNAEQSFVSPDGSLIAFTRKLDDTTYELAAVNADGTQLRTLISSDQFAAMPRPKESIGLIPNQIDWIPGTHTLALNNLYQFMGPGQAISPDLISIDADTGVSTILLSEEETWKFFFSPDGSKIAISLPDGINLYHADGSPAAPSKFVEYSRVNTASEYQWTAEITWKSDSSAFMFTVPPAEPWTENPANTEVKRVPADGFSVTTIYSGPLVYQTPQEISPDLTQIVFLQKVDALNNLYDLHLVPFGGTADIVYAADSTVSNVYWSPDSRYFLYSVNKGEVKQAFLGQMDSAPNQVPQITSLVSAQWIDANRYLVLDWSGNGWKVWLGAVNSEPVMIYSDSLGYDSTPSIHAN